MVVGLKVVNGGNGGGVVMIGGGFLDKPSVTKHTKTSDI